LTEELRGIVERDDQIVKQTLIRRDRLGNIINRQKVVDDQNVSSNVNNYNNMTNVSKVNKSKRSLSPAYSYKK
jgi:hypothetical protein